VRREPDLDFERCPLCAARLTPRPSRFGQVRVCEACMGGTTTLSVLRRVAPKAFVDHLWQSAQRSGRPSVKSCPSCRQPLLSLGPEIEIEPDFDVCIRCYVVWFEQVTLEHLTHIGHEGFAGVAGAMLDALAGRD